MSMTAGRMVRRPVSAAIGAVAALALVGCASGAAGQTGASGADGAGTGDGRPVVLTTFTVLADIAQNVAGDELVVESLTKPGAEIHGYEPTPADLRRAQEADLVVDNGMGLEAWFEQFVADVDAPHVVASEGVEPLDIAEDAYAGAPNPHAWMSPVSVQTYVDNLEAAFAELVPESAEQIADNAEEYRGRIQEVHDELLDDLDAVPQSQRALVTCEGAFSYLARDAGLEEQYLWAVNAEGEGTPQQVRDVIEYVDDHDIPAVFCESTVSDAGMQQVVEATDAEFGGILYVDSLSEDGGDVPTYLDLIRHDARTIAAALTGGDA
jgi:manganese transport system substrate-binding protein